MGIIENTMDTVIVYWGYIAIVSKSPGAVVEIGISTGRSDCVQQKFEGAYKELP